MKKKMNMILGVFTLIVILVLLVSLALIDRSPLSDKERIKTGIILLLLLFPAAVLGLAALLAKNLAAPVDDLISAAVRMRRGDRPYRITGMSRDLREVETLLNFMADSLEKDRVKMQWAEQLVVLGEMAGGLAHEIKNPLAGIKASIDFLSCDSSISPEHREILLQGSEQIKRINGLLKNILDFARPPKPAFMTVNINEVLDGTISLVERHPLLSARETKPISVIRDFVKLPTIMADPLQLQQVFMNLLLNAADAMPFGGCIRVRTDVDEALSSVRIVVSDSGTGINEELSDRIFEPFFTTKEHGTGLGLAVSKGLIEQLGGRIRAENNKESEGTSFVITLPLREPYSELGPAVRLNSLRSGLRINWVTT